MNKKLVELSNIRIDGGTQPREEIDQKTVDEYAESYAALVTMPPVVIYFDGANAWLADGFHRYHAAKKNKNQAIDVEWREGTLEMAKFYAAGANVGHGLRRGDADKKRAILMLLETAQGKKWASEKGEKGSGLKAIAKHCGVSPAWVTITLASIHSEKLPSRAEKRAALEDAIAKNPNAPTREIAAAVGVSHTTVENVRKEKADMRPVVVAAPLEDEPNAPPEVSEAAVDAVNRMAAEKVTERPRAAYKTITKRDTARAIIDSGRAARANFDDDEWAMLLREWDEMIAVREYGKREAG